MHNVVCCKCYYFTMYFVNISKMCAKYVVLCTKNGTLRTIIRKNARKVKNNLRIWKNIANFVGVRKNKVPNDRKPIEIIN